MGIDLSRLRTLRDATPRVVTIVAAVFAFEIVEAAGVTLAETGPHTFGIVLLVVALAVTLLSLRFIWRGPAPGGSLYLFLLWWATVFAGLSGIGPATIGRFGWDDAAPAVFFVALLACATRTSAGAWRGRRTVAPEAIV